MLVLTFPDKLPDDRNGDFMHCDLVLEAPRGMKLFCHILKLHISPDQYHSDRYVSSFFCSRGLFLQNAGLKSILGGKRCNVAQGARV